MTAKDGPTAYLKCVDIARMLMVPERTAGDVPEG
jgi:hypothetical protein